MRETIRQYLYEALVEVTGNSSLPILTDETYLPSLGVTSLNFLEAIQITSNRLNVHVTSEELLGIAKVRQVLDVFERKVSQ